MIIDKKLNGLWFCFKERITEERIKDYFNLFGIKTRSEQYKVLEELRFRGYKVRTNLKKPKQACSSSYLY